MAEECRLSQHLEDNFFEYMPNGKAKAWPEAFLSAIQVGADLSQVNDQFMVWLLIDEQDGVIRFADESKAVVQQVASLYQRRLNGDPPVEDEWDAARAAARDAACAAAWDAAWDAACAAAWDAARDAARDAACAAARAAARAAHYEKMAEKLLELLSQAPVGVQP